MKRNIRKLFIVSTFIVVSVAESQANAAIVSVSGPPSLLGGLPAIIAAPPDVREDAAFNIAQEGFDELQAVILPAPLEVDQFNVPGGDPGGGEFIPAGTLVNSHMIFLNTGPGHDTTLNQHYGVVWTFDNPILGVMSDRNGRLEVASSPLLGAPGTIYEPAPFGARGMEGDSYLVSGNTITVNMGVTEPGDWIRVITRAILEVDIDIKPGSYPNSINPDSGGVIPVAVLSTDIFDASTVDPATVALEGVLAQEKGKSGKYGSLEDVDGDGDLDLVVQIPNTIDWAEDATEATLTGETWDGIPIEGTDSVRIVPPEP